LAFYVIGAISSKYWAIGHSVSYALLTIISYTITTCFLLAVLANKNQLIVMSGIYRSLTSIAVIVIGVGIFKEELSRNQIIGTALSMAAIYFLSR